MQTEDLSKISTEELQKKSKTLKLAVIIIGCSIVMMAISGVIVSIKKGFSALSITPIAFLPLVIIFSAQLKKINEELKRRAS